MKLLNIVGARPQFIAVDKHNREHPQQAGEAATTLRPTPTSSAAPHGAMATRRNNPSHTS